MELLSLLGAVFIVLIVLFLAYQSTRWIAQGHLPGLSAAGRQLEVLDQLFLGKEHRLLVARAGTRYLLLGISQTEVSLLCELTAEEAAQFQKETAPGTQVSENVFLIALRNKLKK